MKRYVYGNDGFNPLILLLWGAAFILTFSITGLITLISKYSHVWLIGPFVLLMPAPVVLAIIFTVRIDILSHITKRAYEGKRDIAEVVEITRTYPKNAHSMAFNITYRYKTKDNEEIIGVLEVSEDAVKYFEKGQIIPIYLNGYYGCFKVDEVIESVTHKSRKKTETYFICPYCDSRVKDSYDSCPNCGAVREY